MRRVLSAGALCPTVRRCLEITADDDGTSFTRGWSNQRRK